MFLAFPPSIYSRRAPFVKQVLDIHAPFGYSRAVMGDEDLHPRRAGILEFLARAESKGDSPTERDIGKAVGLRSAQTAHHHLIRLESDGYVERGEARRTRSHRRIRLTEKGWEAVSTRPLLGRIAAGRGLEAIADEEPFSLVTEILGSGSGKRRMYLRATGDSMRDAGIGTGDILVVEEDPSPPNGARVAAMIFDPGGGEAEATVKKLYREGPLVRLRPENGDHHDTVVEAERVRILGRLLWSIRRQDGRR